MKLNKIFQTGLNQIQTIAHVHDSLIRQEMDHAGNNLSTASETSKRVMQRLCVDAKVKANEIMLFLWEFVEADNKSSKAQYDHVYSTYCQISNDFLKFFNIIERSKNEHE